MFVNFAMIGDELCLTHPSLFLLLSHHLCSAVETPTNIDFESRFLAETPTNVKVSPSIKGLEATVLSWLSSGDKGAALLEETKASICASCLLVRFLVCRSLDVNSSSMAEFPISVDHAECAVRIVKTFIQMNYSFSALPSKQSLQSPSGSLSTVSLSPSAAMSRKGKLKADTRKLLTEVVSFIPDSI
jgi:hypothetical protein